MSGRPTDSRLRPGPPECPAAAAAGGPVPLEFATLGEVQVLDHHPRTAGFRSGAASGPTGPTGAFDRAAFIPEPISASTARRAVPPALPTPTGGQPAGQGPPLGHATFPAMFAPHLLADRARAAGTGLQIRGSRDRVGACPQAGSSGSRSEVGFQPTSSAHVEGDAVKSAPQSAAVPPPEWDGCKPGPRQILYQRFLDILHEDMIAVQ